MKTVICGQVLYSERAINLSVLNSSKVDFVIQESQKVASNLFMIGSCFKLYSPLLRCIYIYLSDWDKLTLFTEGYCMY